MFSANWEKDEGRLSWRNAGPAAWRREQTSNNQKVVNAVPGSRHVYEPNIFR